MVPDRMLAGNISIFQIVPVTSRLVGVLHGLALQTDFLALSPSYQRHDNLFGHV